jgi:putative ABC transport system ATP-binding protein
MPYDFSADRSTPAVTAPQVSKQAIEIHDLWRIYSPGTRQEVQALRGIDLQIDAGTFLALKGRSGSGKTTLINCIGGLDRPTRGTVRVFGYEPYNLDEKQLTLFRRTQVGFIFQSFGLSHNYSAYENIELMLRIGGVPQRERKERVLYCLRLVGLEKWKNHRPDELSGGQQQRIAIARALVSRPRLILADEPTGDLDSTTAKEILSIFRRIVTEEKVTLLISSHDPIVVEYVDRTVNLKDGRLLSEN